MSIPSCLFSNNDASGRLYCGSGFMYGSNWCGEVWSFPTSSSSSSSEKAKEAGLVCARLPDVPASIAGTSDGRWLFVGGDLGRIAVIDTTISADVEMDTAQSSDGQQHQHQHHQSKGVLKVDPHGYSSNVVGWTPAHGRHTINSLRVGKSDPSLLVSGGGDGCVCLWSCDTLAEQCANRGSADDGQDVKPRDRRLLGGPHAIVDVAWQASAPVVVVANERGELHWWDTRENVPGSALTRIYDNRTSHGGPRCPITALAWSENERFLAVGDRDGRVTVLDSRALHADPLGLSSGQPPILSQVTVEDSVRSLMFVNNAKLAFATDSGSVATSFAEPRKGKKKGKANNNNDSESVVDAAAAPSVKLCRQPDSNPIRAMAWLPSVKKLAFAPQDCPILEYFSV